MKITQPDGTVYELTHDEALKVLEGFSNEIWSPAGIELRQKIANAFSKRYLKGVAHTAEFKTLKREVEESRKVAIKEQLAEYFKVATISGVPYLTAGMKQRIQQEVGLEFEKAYSSSFETAKKDVEERLEKKLLATLNSHLRYSMENFIYKEVESLLKKVVTTIRGKESEDLKSRLDEWEKTQKAKED